MSKVTGAQLFKLSIVHSRYKTFSRMFYRVWEYCLYYKSERDVDTIDFEIQFEFRTIL